MTVCNEMIRVCLPDIMGSDICVRYGMLDGGLQKQCMLSYAIQFMGPSGIFRLKLPLFENVEDKEILGWLNQFLGSEVTAVQLR